MFTFQYARAGNIIYSVSLVLFWFEYVYSFDTYFERSLSCYYNILTFLMFLENLRNDCPPEGGTHNVKGTGRSSKNKN